MYNRPDRPADASQVEPSRRARVGGGRLLEGASEEDMRILEWIDHCRVTWRERLASCRGDASGEQGNFICTVVMWRLNVSSPVNVVLSRAGN
jgi:hypothetical protein